MLGSNTPPCRTLIVASADGSSPRCAAEVLASWPSHVRPTLRTMTLEQIFEQAAPEQAAPEQAAPEQEGTLSIAGCMVLVDLSRIATERVADRVLHVLADCGCLGVALLHPAMLEHCSRAQHAAKGGMIVRSASTPPALVGAMLQALSEREPVVDGLRHEVSLLRRAHERSMHEVQKLHEELHLAAALQRELAATSLPAIAGLDLGVLHRPVSTVSGDVHCIRAIGPRLVAFFVADAVGHGVPAALMTMVLLSGLAAHMQHRDEHEITFSPALVLESLNRKLLAHGFGCERFATAVCGVVDVCSGRVRIAGAGHPPPIVVGRCGTRALETSGPLLGVFDDAAFDETETMLAPGERLIAYSDGLEGALPRTGTSLLHQLAPLEATLRNHEAACGSAAIDAIAHLLDNQAGSLHQLDDVTVLAMRVLGTSLEARIAA